MPTMPAGLKPVVEGYRVDEPGGVLRTEVGGGAGRYVLEYGSAPQRFSVNMILDAVQFEVWTLFYFHIINKGAIPFNMQLDSGFGGQLYPVTIVPGSYTAQRVGGPMWYVSIVAETMGAAEGLSDAEAVDLAGLFNVAGIKPVVSGYGMADPGGVFRSGIAGAHQANALEWLRGVQFYAVTLILDPAQFKRWSVYYARIIKRGAITFSMPIDSGFGVAPHDCNIVPGSYSAARTGGVFWSVTFTVEAESQAYSMSAAEAAAFVALYGAVGTGSAALLARIAAFALVDTLVLVGL